MVAAPIGVLRSMNLTGQLRWPHASVRGEAEIIEDLIQFLAALQREAHGRTVTQLERRDDPLPPTPGASFAERMIHRTVTAAGRIRYKLHQQTVEPTFGIIKEVLGFRRFSLRGESKAALEWTLVSLAFNIKRLHTLGEHLTLICQCQPSRRSGEGPKPEEGPMRASAPASGPRIAGLARAKPRRPIWVADRAPARSEERRGGEVGR